MRTTAPGLDTRENETIVMRIHQCARCEGCGYVTRGFRWEVAWSRWADPKDPKSADGWMEPSPCPDCGGTGALIQLDYVTQPESRLASRRGLPRDEYAEHVAALLELRTDA